MINMKRQQGMTFLGWLFTLAMIGFFVLIILKIVPIYLDYFKVKRSWIAFSENTDELYKLNQAQAYRNLERYLIVESMDEVIGKKDIEITKTRDTKTFTINYVREEEFVTGLFIQGRFKFEHVAEYGDD